MYLKLSESPAVLSIDTPITWYSKTDQTQCKCRLRVYKVSFDKAIAILSELEDNPGRSIIDESSSLIHLVCDALALSPRKTMWVEHYPYGYLQEEDIYDEVMQVQGCTYSKKISKQKIEALLGVKLTL